MFKFILIIFLLCSLTPLASAQGLFNHEISIGYNPSAQPSPNYQEERQREEQRVGSYYIPSQQVAASINETINRTNSQMQGVFNNLTNSTLISSSNFSNILGKLGANYNFEQQRVFINSILSSTGKLQSSSLVTVLPYLSDLKPVKLANQSSDFINKARLKVSATLSNSYKNCQNSHCSALSLATTKVALDSLINMATNNAVNAELLSEWGEDITHAEDALQSFNSQLENLSKLELKDVIKELSNQQETNHRLEQITQEWGVELQDNISNSDKNELDIVAKDVIELKQCIADNNCNNQTITAIAGDSQYAPIHKQLESIANSSNLVSGSNIEPQYKNSAFDFLDISIDALLTGDIEGSKSFEELAMAIVDIGLGLVPVVSIGKDAYELITGISLVTREQLSTLERSLSAVGILTLGASNLLVKASSKILSKLKLAPEILATADKIIHAAKKLGNLPKEKILSFTESFKKNKNIFGRIEEISEKISKSKAFKNAVNELPNDKAMFYVKETGEAIPSTSYKYIDSNSRELNNILEEGILPARHSSKPHYSSFQKYDDSSKAIDGLQLARRPDGTLMNDARYRVEFDTLQVVDDIQVPRGKWGEADYLEPLTSDYPEFGQGGASQIIFNNKVRVKEVVDLRTGQLIFSADKGIP